MSTDFDDIRQKHGGGKAAEICLANAYIPEPLEELTPENLTMHDCDRVVEECTQVLEDQKPRIYSFDEFRALPRPPMLLDGLCRAIGVGLIYGPTGSGKSHFVSALARAAQFNWSFGQYPWVKNGKTLYVSSEDLHGFCDRIEASQTFFGEDLDIDIYNPEFELVLSDRDSVFELIEAAKAKNYAMIIIETLSLILGNADENNNSDIARSLKTLSYIARETETFIWVTHHSGHSEKGRERGASSLRANVDCSLGLTKDGQTITVKIAKSKYGPQGHSLLFDLSNQNSLGNFAATFHAIPCIDFRQHSGNLRQLAETIWRDLADDYPEPVNRWEPWKKRVLAEAPTDKKPTNDNFSKWFQSFTGATLRQLRATQDDQTKVATTTPPMGGGGNSLASRTQHWQDD
jgi:archaellum biogenesis ATPase FlaH